MNKKLLPLASALVLAIVSGVAEYILSGGTSGWIPLVAGAVGVVAGWLVLYIFSPDAKSQASPAAPAVKRSASELMDLFSGGLTSIEAKNLVGPHIGSIIEFCGEVSNVSETSSGSVTVYFWIGELRLLGAGLDPSCADEGRRLRVGDRVCVSGKIKEIEKRRFRMEACRFTPPADPDQS